MNRYLGPLVLGLAGAAMLLALGFWQVDRLGWKRAVLAEIDARIGEQPQPLPQMPRPDRDRYLPVHLEGRGEPRELHVLVGHKRLGAGFRVVTGFEDISGRRVLVDLGFIVDEDKDLRRGPLRGALAGNLHWPDDRNPSTPANDIGGNIWFARDLDAMAAELGTEPVLVVLREAAGLDAAITPMPLDSSVIPNDHLQYAITWFSLALVWLGMTGYWLWRIRRRND